MPRGGARIGAGRPNKSGKVKPVSAKPEKDAKPNQGSEVDEPVILDNDTPLDYILKVMNNPAHDTNTRLKAASLAAPFVHARKGEGEGKKSERDAKAKTAGTGKFAASPPPLKLVK